MNTHVYMYAFINTCYIHIQGAFEKGGKTVRGDGTQINEQISLQNVWSNANGEKLKGSFSISHCDGLIEVCL